MRGRHEQQVADRTEYDMCPIGSTGTSGNLTESQSPGVFVFVGLLCRGANLLQNTSGNRSAATRITHLDPVSKVLSGSRTQGLGRICCLSKSSPRKLVTVVSVATTSVESGFPPCFSRQDNVVIGSAVVVFEQCILKVVFDVIEALVRDDFYEFFVTAVAVSHVCRPTLQ